MKKSSLLLILLSISMFAQRSKTPWDNNRSNEKQHSLDVLTTFSKQVNITDFNNQNSFIIRNESNKTNTSKNSQNSSTLINGINIAWVNFGRDIGMDTSGNEYHPTLNKFGEIMDYTVKYGGNVIRWWYHTNGSTNPVFQNQKVIRNPEFFHTDVKSILDLAHSKGLKVQICLWSFDMLKDQWGVDATANKLLLTQNEHRQAYIDNALLPLVNAIGNHPGLYAWEIFNEPEGMTNAYASHWNGFVEKVEMPAIQAFINKASGAIRRAQPAVKITNGALGLLTNMEDSSKGFWNAYSDANLINAGEDQDGYLDFYNIHYYQWAGKNGSPFHNNFDPNKIDKKTVVGEYYPDNLSVGGSPTINASDLGNKIKENNWGGSLVWSWTDRTSSSDRSNMAAIISSLSQHNNNNNNNNDDDDNSSGDFVNTVEAETANLSGNAAIVNDNSASNNKYVQLTSNPSTINFTINAVATTKIYTVGIYNRSFNGDDQYGSKTQQITSSANNKTIDHVFEPSQTWKIDYIKLTLNQGSNTIAINADWGYMDIDKIQIIDSLNNDDNDDVSSEDFVSTMEAEISNLSGSATIMNDNSASNSKYVQLASDPSIINFTINNVPTANTYTVGIYNRSFNGNDKYGSKIQQITSSANNVIIDHVFEPSQIWKIDYINLNLNKGSNTIAIKANWGYMDIDKIQVTNTSDLSGKNNITSNTIQDENLSNAIINSKNITYSRVRNTNIDSNDKLKIYPNPAFEDLSIVGISKGDNILIYNYLGVLILEQTIKFEKEKINVSRLTSGWYILKVKGLGSKAFLKY